MLERTNPRSAGELGRLETRRAKSQAMKEWEGGFTEELSFNCEKAWILAEQCSN